MAMNDFELLEKVNAEPVIHVLEEHLDTRPPLTRKKHRFGQMDRKAAIEWYRFSAWQGGMIALMRDVLTKFLQAAWDSEGLFLSALEATPHPAEEEAAMAAMAQYRERGGDLESYFREAVNPESSPDMVMRASNALTGLTIAVAGEIGFEPPKWVYELNSWLNP